MNRKYYGKTIFELSHPGRRGYHIADTGCPESEPLPEGLLRADAPRLPEVDEPTIVRHYTNMSANNFGVDSGFYPLGSCTMKYNPKINEEMAALPQMAALHPNQPESTVQGALEAYHTLQQLLSEIGGMSEFTLNPFAGAHGELTGLMVIRAYHRSRGDHGRTKVIVPDSAHGTNPASAVMAGFTVVNIPSGPDGCVDVEALRQAVGPDTAGLMLTNPNTVGIFDKNILEITKTVHEAGGLCYYDGANLNAVMGVVRPGDMGFDVIHLNLHKTFSTPHGGGGPGAGAVGCKALLAPFLPGPVVEKSANGYRLVTPEQSIGRVKNFCGNFGVVVRALTYVLTLGREGIPEAAKNAVLNANYMMKRLSEKYTMAYAGPCMHEFVMDLQDLKAATGCSAMDIAKGLLDHGIHPPTMYFPLIVHEALMIEPTETESRETMDEACDVFLALWDLAHEDSQSLHDAPVKTPVRRLDEVGAARNPVLRYTPNA